MKVVPLRLQLGADLRRGLESWHRLGPAQRCFRLAEGLQVASAQPADAEHHQLA
jgi:hypothetical protein